MTSPTPLIHNPRAGGGRGAALAAEAVRLLAAQGVEARLEPTAGPGGASPLAERLAREGATRILALGGDGTVSEAADGILRAGGGAALGALPAGTGNDFLRDFGVLTLADGVARIAAAKERRVDAALATWPGGERHFVNVFGVGFAARVCDYANRRLKWMGGAGYTWAVFPELLRLRSPVTRLVLDGRVMEEPLALVAVCNTTHTGGKMMMAPGAEPDDGLLDVIALREVGRVELLRLFRLLFRGEHVGDPSVIVARAREVQIAPTEPSPLLGDGEVYGATPVVARVLPGALRVLL